MGKRVLTFGALNIDHVYQVDHIARPGETLVGTNYARFAGGKGANQSVAVARAGGSVVHIGRVGREGEWMVRNMRSDGVDVSHIVISDEPAGHAIIQVDRQGENSIVVYGGTNRQITEQQIEAAFLQADENDLVLIQNEINNIPFIIQTASRRSLPVYFNTAPMSPEVKDYPLEHVHAFIINETEGEELTGSSGEEQIIEEMLKLYPRSQVILTLGGRGALYSDAERTIRRDVERKVKPADTTGAGDTFVGYYMAAVSRGEDVEEALRLAGVAAAYCVTKPGANDSIPRISDLESF
jgi:ribokinase